MYRAYSETTQLDVELSCLMFRYVQGLTGLFYRKILNDKKNVTSSGTSWETSVKSNWRLGYVLLGSIQLSTHGLYIYCSVFRIQPFPGSCVTRCVLCFELFVLMQLLAGADPGICVKGGHSLLFSIPSLSARGSAFLILLLIFVRPLQQCSANAVHVITYLRTCAANVI